MSHQRVWPQRVAQSGGASSTGPRRTQVAQRGQPENGRCTPWAVNAPPHNDMPRLMGAATRSHASLSRYVVARPRAILRCMHASPTADLGRPAELRLTLARLYVFAALLCGAGGLALGQPAGVRWALLVFGAAFLCAALQAALAPPASTPGPQSRPRGNSVPRRLDLRRAVAESRGRTRRCGRRVGS
jgi:hypothetical protein